MAGASDPLEDMLFSEVDEKAVSDLVGSLESQLVGQSEPPAARQSSAKQQQQQTGGTAQLPAPVDSPSEPQQQAQQQQNAGKAARNPDSDPKDASMDKHAKALEKESPLKSHGSIIIITTAAAAAASDAPAPGNKGESPRDTRKKPPGNVNSRALRSAVSHSLNGNGDGAASASASASASSPSTTITVSSSPQAIALDRGTPPSRCTDSRITSSPASRRMETARRCPRWSSRALGSTTAKHPRTTTRSQRRPRPQQRLSNPLPARLRSSDLRRRRRAAACAAEGRNAAADCQTTATANYYTAAARIHHPTRYYDLQMWHRLLSSDSSTC